MSMFINQMLGCLIIAAGIGGVVGWLLRNVSAGTVTQQLADVTAMMRLKEQMLEKARHQLREAASNIQERENKIIALQPHDPSKQKELSSNQKRIQTLQEELAAAKLQLSAWESGQTRLPKRVSDSAAETLAQTEEAPRSKTDLEAVYTQAAAQ